MSVLVVVQGTAHPDRLDTLAQYQSVARTVISRHGGQNIGRGQGLKSIQGGRQHGIGLIFRFPDLASVEGWYNDPEYQKVIPLRTQAYSELEINVYQE